MEIPLQKLKSWQKLKSPAGAKSLELKFICRISFWLNYIFQLEKFVQQIIMKNSIDELGLLQIITQHERVEKVT